MYLADHSKKEVNLRPMLLTASGRPHSEHDPPSTHSGPKSLIAALKPTRNKPVRAQGEV